MRRGLQADELLDETGDGIHDIYSPWGIVADPTGSIYVTGVNSDNAIHVSALSVAPLLDPSAIALLAGALATAGSAILRKARDY